MGKILDALVTFFEDDQWEFSLVEERNALHIHYSGVFGTLAGVAWAREDESEFIFYSIYRKPIPANKRPAVAELITRINYGMFIGNFEMDYDDGELRYKTSVDIEDGELTSNLIRPIVYLNFNRMDKYLPAIQAVVEDGMAPRPALNSINAPNN